MKIRFWQKTYLFTLLLFLLCLYAGIFSLAYYTYERSVSEAESTSQAEQSYIALSFERDFADMLASGSGASPTLLMQSYGTHYEKKGIFLSFSENGELLYSDLPDGELPQQEERIHSLHLDGKRYVLIRTSLCDRYRFTYCKDVSELDGTYRSLMLIYTLVAVCVSVVLAIALLLMLKRLSVPLERLRKTTEQISAGDLSVETDASGKDEFAQLGKSFNGMVTLLREQMTQLEQDADRKQMLVDNLAHELRTPLTSIQGYAEYLEKAAASEEDRIDAAIWIRSEAERLQNVSQKLLEMSIIRNDELQFCPVRTDLLLEDTARRLCEKAKTRSVNLQFRLSESTVSGDETLLSMLFYNLTENAIKACEEGGHVTLFCEEKTVCITDDGKGMTNEQLSHITEPFYRTDKNRSRAEGGAGLGLALCKLIADKHGASLQFTSAPGKGTSVSLQFP